MHPLEMKSHLMACVLAGITSTSIAQIATVGFVGRVVNTTCSVAIRGANASAQAGALDLPAVSAFPVRVAGETYGRTAFALGVGDCAAASAPAPVVSITSPQAVGGYIASGVHNLLIELGTESTVNNQHKSVPMVITQTPDRMTTPRTDLISTGFYIQYRAVVGTVPGTVPDTARPGDNTTVAPTTTTITIHLMYV